MRSDGVNCEAMQQAMRERHELAKDQLCHLYECEPCMDLWLTAALDEKPEVKIPPDFAARVAAVTPTRPEKRETARTPRHWGVISAMAVVTVVLVICFAVSPPPNSWVETALVLLVATEIAGLALWLGPKWTRL